MKYKNDWSDAQKRLTALWHGEMLDRPCLAVRAPHNCQASELPPVPKSAEARWLDPEYLADAARYQITHTWWGGEAIPSYLLQATWVLCLGGTPVFTPETIWYEKRKIDFGETSPFRIKSDDYWVQRYMEALFALANLAGKNDFLVGSPGTLPANDLLSMQMGTENFLLALLDEPAWMAKALLDGAKDLINIRIHLQNSLRSQHEFWYGNAGWMPFWAPEPYVSSQSDVSCMLSPELFDHFVLPEIDLYGQIYGALWYHLDGHDAVQHLPRLLSLPYLRVVQYVPTPSEPPNGIQHLELYKAIQAAGKIVHIDAPWQQVEPLLLALDPARLFIQTHCDSIEAGEWLLQQSADWARHK
ncbi:MAG: hypothetical protein SCM11_03255 [Bacillota bacterium]|nr:hypothetical protein [Bacillota bacterium]